ncbi:MAG: metal-dependent transcriptional regulator [Anaerovoracaceae bacterium]
MALRESGEMYLETILVLKREKGNVRSIDVANALEYSKPSVSRAIGILKRDGLVIVDNSGQISLTDEGVVIAERIFKRHTVLSEFLMSLGVNEDVAKSDACRMEHVISDETLRFIEKALLKKID